MGNLVKTLRITKFKGLNKSVNPHNLHDAEFSELINAELTKNGTVQSRRGYSVVGSLETIPNKYVESIYKTTIGGAPTLYYHGGLGLYKMDESDGSTTNIAAPIISDQRAQFLRYHDRVLFLSEGQRLKWFDSDEVLQIAQYPTFGVAAEFRTPPPGDITASVGGGLDPSTYYQYALSVVCGNEGESALSGGLTGGFSGTFDYPIHAYATTTDVNLTIITQTDHLYYRGNTHGFDITMLRLFRRKGYPGIDAVGGGGGAENWVLLDEAELLIDGDGVITDGLTTRRQGDDGNEVIITDITGLLISTGEFEFTLSFIDKGNSGVNEAQQPRDAISSITPSAKYMARLWNRILIANITGTGDAIDAKKVYYSYRGYNKMTDEMEIPDFQYPHPMLIFPQDNHFYCDEEDVEDEITAITSYKNSILIFTERCTFLWEEGMADPMKLSNDVGCMSHPSIQEFEGKLIWLGRNGFYQYDGNKLTNLTWEKMQPYMDAFTWSVAHHTVSTIYDRKYFVSVPLYGLLWNNYVFVYDFDLKTWHVRQYSYTSGGSFYIRSMFTHRDGSGETLYAGGTNGNLAQVVKLEQGGKDSNQWITVTAKTKYYDFGAPDIQKTVRNFYLDIENYYGGYDEPADNATFFSGELYLDGLAGPVYTFKMTPPVESRVMLLGNAGRTLNYSYVGVIGDESLALSMERGLIGSRLMFGFSMIASEAVTRIHSLGIDWLPKRKLKRVYGGT